MKKTGPLWFKILMGLTGLFLLLIVAASQWKAQDLFKQTALQYENLQKSSGK